jgi:hypothetical protein
MPSGAVASTCREVGLQDLTSWARYSIGGGLDAVMIKMADLSAPLFLPSVAGVTYGAR